MKRLLTCFLLLLCVVSMSAQILMKIKIDNATELNKQDDYITLPASAVKNITFEKVVPPKVDTTLVVTIPASDITESSATIQFNLQPTGIAVSKYVVKYEKKEKFDLNDIDNMKGASGSNSRVYLSNLDPNTEYRCWGYVELTNGNRVMATRVEDFTTKVHTLSQPIIQFGEIKADYTTATVSLIISGEQLAGSEYALYCSADYNQLGTPASFVSHTGTLGATGANLTYSLENLMEGTTYYLMANVATGDGRSNAAEKNFTTREHISYVEPEPIDLGLSVKWASFNLGASTETENGGYFGWGDATGEETRFREGWYAPGVRETGIRGNVEYDIAAAKLGGHWRLPTPAEVLELQKCSPTHTSISGVYGVLLRGIGNKNGNSIFIPYAGYRQETAEYAKGNKAYLWTDSINRAEEAYRVEFLPANGILAATPDLKANLMTVRAVWDDGSGTVPSEPDPSEPDPTDPSFLAKEGTENNPDTGAIPQDGVDMGLPSGTKWARWNVGCMTANGSKGFYYAWGATEPQEDNNYSLANYESNPYYNVSIDDIQGGVLSAEHDIATQLWGEEWRMPTEGEFQELFLLCEKTWTTENGVPGYSFTNIVDGKTVSVFLPAAGHRSNTSLLYDDEEGRYWTRNAWSSNDMSQKREWATNFIFYSDAAPQISGTGRYQGLQIRPVKPIEK